MHNENKVEIGQEVVWTRKDSNGITKVLNVDNEGNMTVEIYGRTRIFNKYGFSADGYNDRTTLGCLDRKRLLSHKLENTSAYHWRELDLETLEEIVSKVEKTIEVAS